MLYYSVFVLRNLFCVESFYCILEIIYLIYHEV